MKVTIESAGRISLDDEAHLAPFFPMHHLRNFLKGLVGDILSINLKHAITDFKLSTFCCRTTGSHVANINSIVRRLLQHHTDPFKSLL